MGANDGEGNDGGTPGTTGDVAALADRFVDLACLCYADGESVEPRREAEALAVARELVARGASLDARDPIYGGRPAGHAEHFARRWPTPGREETMRFLVERTPP